MDNAVATTVTVNPHNAGTSVHGVTLTSSGTRKGRPPKYNNCLDLAWACEDYFEQCDEGKQRQKLDSKTGKVVTWQQQEPYTIVGLACHLKAYDERWVDQYSSRSEDFARVVKSALLRIEAQRNTQLLTSEANTIGSIFLLKACHGYKDAPEQQATQGVQVIINGDLFGGQHAVTATQGQQAIEKSGTITLDVACEPAHTALPIGDTD